MALLACAIVAPSVTAQTVNAYSLSGSATAGRIDSRNSIGLGVGAAAHSKSLSLSSTFLVSQLLDADDIDHYPSGREPCPAPIDYEGEFNCRNANTVFDLLVDLTTSAPVFNSSVFFGGGYRFLHSDRAYIRLGIYHEPNDYDFGFAFSGIIAKRHKEVMFTVSRTTPRRRE